MSYFHKLVFMYLNFMYTIFLSPYLIINYRIKLRLTKSVISAYETGLRLPSYDVLIHIAKIFKVSTDYLLGMEQKQEIDLSGLSQEEIDALLNLIKAMRHH